MQTQSSGLVLRIKGDKLPCRVPLKKRKHEIKRKYEKKPTKLGLARGRWERWERVRFLEGLRIHGKGKWKQIARMIPTSLTGILFILISSCLTINQVDYSSQNSRPDYFETNRSR